VKLFATLACFCFATQAAAECTDTRIDLRGEWGTARFTIEIADDPQERSLGLMHRDSMPKSAGMLFVYERPQKTVFWMKDTLIPLDMIFADETGVVTRVHENARPLDLTGIDGGDGVQFVLEINGGLAERLGIKEGSEMRHPLIGEEAVWACE
jgi:uncharacterized membrane protein (UPF0127 family)